MLGQASMNAALRASVATVLCKLLPQIARLLSKVKVSKLFAQLFAPIKSVHEENCERSLQTSTFFSQLSAWLKSGVTDGKNARNRAFFRSKIPGSKRAEHDTRINRHRHIISHDHARSAEHASR